MLSLPRRERKTRETSLAKRIRLALNRIPGVWCAQNVVGLFYNEAGIRVRCGLGVGTPDIMGVLELSEIGKLPVAAAFGLEVKTPHGRNAHPEIQAGQKTWRALAQKRGLLTDVVTSEREACAAVDAFRSEFIARIRVFR